MYDDTQKDTLKTIFEHIISQHVAPELTIDKLDAFTGKKSGKHIVNLTSTNPSTEYLSIINELRTAAIEAGAQLEGYRLHVTLGRIHGVRASLIQFRRFCLLSDWNLSPSHLRIPSSSILMEKKSIPGLLGHVIDDGRDMGFKQIARCSGELLPLQSGWCYQQRVCESQSSIIIILQTTFQNYV